MSYQQEQHQKPVTSITNQEEKSSEFQCPDCSTYLSVWYDERSSARYHCENCENDVTAQEIISEWDSPTGDSSDDYENCEIDNNISAFSIA